LKELNKRCQKARRQKGAWERWNRKMPHNRVRTQRLVDAEGRVVGFGFPEPMPEPPLKGPFCQKKTLPSGKVVIVFRGEEIEKAYRQARRPVPALEQVEHALLAEEEVRRLHEEACP
jgi:hypothetical protein